MISCFCFVFLFQYYFNEGAYLPFMSIFNKALKDVLFIFCYLRKGQCFPFNVEYWTNKIMRGLNFSSSSLIRFKQQQMLESRETVNDKIVILDMVKKIVVEKYDVLYLIYAHCLVPDINWEHLSPHIRTPRTFCEDVVVKKSSFSNPLTENIWLVLDRSCDLLAYKSEYQKSRVPRKNTEMRWARRFLNSELEQTVYKHVDVSQEVEHLGILYHSSKSS